MEQIRLLLVDDEPAVRRGLRMRLELEADVEVVGEAGDGRAAVEAARDLSPNVVLMDVDMPVLDGIAATSELQSVSPGSRVVVISIHDDPVTVGGRTQRAHQPSCPSIGSMRDCWRRSAEPRQHRRRGYDQRRHYGNNTRGYQQ